MKAIGTYSVKKWEETLLDQISSEMKMTKSSVEFSMGGQIDGKAFVEYLMFYKYYDENDQHKSSAMYIGLIRFVGKVHDKAGNFVIEDHGTFENGAASSKLKIIEGSGLGELKGINGIGRYSANHEGAQIELDYSL